MHRPMLSLTNRLWLAGTCTVALSVAASTALANPFWGVGLAVAGSISVRLWFAHSLRPLDALRRRMAEVSAENQRQEVLIKAQNELFNNMTLLRDSLFIHGEPRRVGNDLYFGDRRINGNFQEVDEVKAKAGGNATIFAGDTRIATNVLKADGSRAVGTTLAAGPAHDSVFRHGRTYSGEAEILGVPCLTIYEPIVSEGAVIGILFAGVKRDECAQVQTDGGSRDTLVEMEAAVAHFEAAAVAKGKAERDSAEQRYLVDAARRQTEMLRRNSAASQAVVVDALSVALDRLSAGDLMHRMEVEFPADYSKLKIDYNAALDKLRAAMRSIGQGAGTMHSNSGEISQAADDLSRRTEQQAASLEETAAALDELTNKVRRSAEGAQKAQELVSAARSKAEESGEVVRHAILAMSEIDSSAKQIAQIMSVIDEIAFQTNLLALNAGVEAARAGDSGKGFAVVASEVRALAQRSADAAKQVRALISSSSAHVGTGVQLVSDTGKALMGIIEGVAEINVQVQNIAISARDQASGLREVNIAVGAMDKVTQQNAAMVEQTTAASRTLTSEAEDLVTMVGRFRIGEPADARRGSSPHVPVRQARVA